MIARGGVEVLELLSDVDQGTATVGVARRRTALPVAATPHPNPTPSTPIGCLQGGDLSKYTHACRLLGLVLLLMGA
jgi:hypothetical protein